MPRVSIGLPVYNGEKFLRDALDSILAQHFEDFELIICDNASTDNTQKICQTYAQMDQRIRYYRNNKNVGAAKNFNAAFKLSKGHYFKWAAHDDICDREFISKCVQVLDQDQSVVLCHSRTKLIDEKGHFIKKDYNKLNIHSYKPQHRYHDLVLLRHSCFHVFGLIRSEALRKTSLIGTYTSSDRVLLVELSLHGRFFEIPEYLFLRRNHSLQSVQAYDYRSRIVWFDPTKIDKYVFPIWRIFFEYIKVIKRVPLKRQERMGCYMTVVRWIMKRWPGLMHDIFSAGQKFVSQI